MANSSLISAIKSNCNGCKACQNICPRQCIEVKINRSGEFKPYIDSQKCINCGLCKTHCPILDSPIKTNKILALYSAKNEQQEVIMKSSSGGLFSAFAEHILNNDGIVVGAAFEKNFQVKLIIIDDLKDIDRIRRSKYVRAEVGDIYVKIEKHLKDNRLVLFAGTPCQILGLKKFLKKEYSKLYTIELLCAGTPLPKVWEKYLVYQERSHKSVINSINFRDKSEGWLNFHLTIDFSDGQTYSASHNEDPYLEMFLNNLSLTEPCYSCFAKTLKVSDVCMGDFWSVGKFVSDIDDIDRGVSVIIIHSKKGQDLFDSISSKIKYSMISDTNVVLKSNPEYFCSASKPKSRKKFINNLDKLTFDELALKTEKRDEGIVQFIRTSIGKCKTIIKRVLKRILNRSTGDT